LPAFADDDQLRMLVLTTVATAGLMLPTVRRARSSKLAAPAMNLLDQIGRAMSGGGGSDLDLPPLDDRAPAWEELRAQLDAASTEHERSFRQRVADGSGPEAMALASKRTFDDPAAQPRVTLYRDTAAWCPYCEKVWLLLEEKRVPYAIEKVNMNCYGEKPEWFWQMQPSGGIPVAKVDGQVVRESNDIMMAIEGLYADQRPMLPAADDPRSARVRPLLQLERELFSCWFRWLTSGFNNGAQRINFEATLDAVERELGEGGGPYFLGDDVTLVDCMFAPFLERMAASLPYYKALPIRRQSRWPNVEAWFVAMEGRPSYRHIQSDFYTHVHDLPPQIGGCQSVAEAAPYAAAIDGDGGAWELPLPEDDEHQPLAHLGLAPDAARRQAAERLLANHAAVVRFAARGAGRPGFPPVSAEFSDPNATPSEAAVPLVDAALRHVVHALLAGPDAAAANLSPLEPATTVKALGYLRDRVSVPRDMSYPAARQLRAHLNWMAAAVQPR